ncbi:hypothetical protein LPJ53_001569 [Coemansia erecta]|uniref:Glutathione S-transferase n=1 Tax=Coemansia erecta TaxID=147472 RepID=A0A9W8CUQ3_9FUNG|nr:hypothetical protein LPJ53_001569 [Coemansia erecta]
MSSSSSSSFVLRYFPIHARAETIKAMLSFSGTEYKFETPEWPQQKSEQPVGKLPVLIETAEDGSEFVICESYAIEVYLARKFKLSPGDTAQVVARQVELRSQLKDIYDYAVLHKHASPDMKEVFWGVFSSLATDVVKYHEKFLAENGSNGHYFGDKTTYIDLAAYGTYRFLTDFIAETNPDAKEFFSKEKAPLMNKVFEAVAAEPTIAGYLATFD